MMQSNDQDAKIAALLGWQKITVKSGGLFGRHPTWKTASRIPRFTHSPFAGALVDWLDKCGWSFSVQSDATSTTVTVRHPDGGRAVTRSGATLKDAVVAAMLAVKT